MVPGQRYFIEVTGTTSDAFAAGAYQLQVSFPNGIVGLDTTQGAARLHRGHLRRSPPHCAPTTAELSSWTQAPQLGASPQQLTVWLYQSPSASLWRSTACLRRTWAWRCRSDRARGVFGLAQVATSEDVTLAIIASPEFVADHPTSSSVVTAYQDVLGRAPDAWARWCSRSG